MNYEDSMNIQTISIHHQQDQISKEIINKNKGKSNESNTIVCLFLIYFNYHSNILLENIHGGQHIQLKDV